MDGISRDDRELLRALATEVAGIAALPAQAEMAARWRKLNDLEPTRPMVLVCQIPWHELEDGGGELELRTTGKLWRSIERRLRQTLYQWRHMRGDMVVSPFLVSASVLRDTGYGIRQEADQITQGTAGAISARHYHGQFESEADLEKIKTPVVTLNREATEANARCLTEILGDILPVRVQGMATHCFAPWDRLAEWWNPQRLLEDLILRPELLHKAVDRLVAAHLAQLDQHEKLGLLSVSDGNVRTSQGGLGYTRDLPRTGYTPGHARLCDLWGGSMAQIFSEVSPAMHAEFALQYEARYMKRFGLTYYGCCEPLHHKVDIVRKYLPNLRKISMSTWVDPGKAAEAVGDTLVFSFKPNPAFLATDGTWDRPSARRQIETLLETARGCRIEVILKDISTVRSEPRRLWEWTDMAMELVRRYE